ncbi:MAG: hypothetical protein WCE75_09585 [Terracidiphilus sp.]
MKRVVLIALFFLAAASFAAAQIGTISTDVLGAHLNYGRGCAACHAPHSGAFGNGIKTTDTSTGNIALWGEDVGPLVGKTIVTGQSEHGSYSETLPAVSAGTVDVSGVLMCLSCHDGNYATGAMMQNAVYEKLPATYGTNPIPTLLGKDGTGLSNYLNDHPVGLNAIFACGGGYNWDCTLTGASVSMTGGTYFPQFVKNYGFFVKLGNNGGSPVVLCTTCHNQHVMNVVNIASGATNTGLPKGSYTTMFFLRAPYNPNSTTTDSNQTAQFCRQCHGGESNEMNGSTATTTF